MSYKSLSVDPAADGMCACPVCGAAYSIAEIPCKHFVGDWCFSAGYEPGSTKGQWANAAGEEVLIAFDVAIEVLKDLIENREWRSEKERRRALASLPKHLRNAIRGWRTLLDERISAAPGYLGTHEVETDSMAGDAWNVHWADDGSTAASAVERLFGEDVKLLQAVGAQAEKLVLPE